MTPVTVLPYWTLGSMGPILILKNSNIGPMFKDELLHMPSDSKFWNLVSLLLNPAETNYNVFRKFWEICFGTSCIGQISMLNQSSQLISIYLGESSTQYSLTRRATGWPWGVRKFLKICISRLAKNGCPGCMFDHIGKLIKLVFN